MKINKILKIIFKVVRSLLIAYFYAFSALNFYLYQCKNRFLKMVIIH